MPSPPSLLQLMKNKQEMPSPEEQHRLSRARLLELLKRHTKYKVELVSGKGSAMRRFRITYAEHSITLQERPGGASIQMETGRRKEDRISTQTRCWLEALRQAERVILERAFADHVQPDQEIATTPAAGDPDLFVVIELYVRKRFSGKNAVSAAHARKLDRVFAIIEHVYGLRRPVSYFGAQFVERYVDLRTTREITFPAHFDRRACGKVKVRTAIGELKDFAGVLQFATKKGVIRSNPLEGYNWETWLAGDQNAVEHMEEAHTRRYPLLLARPHLLDSATGERLEAPVHRIICVDGGARLRCILAFMFHHGHRWVSVQSILCEDIALTREEMQALLREAPNHREWWADWFPHGGILWRRSKVDYLRFTPFSRAMRSEIDRWRAHHPCWRPGVPLFPQMHNRTKAVSDSSVREWVRKAHEIARADQARLGVPREQVERWLSGAILHGYRDHWATVMDQLGYGWDAARKGNSKLDLHNHVAFCGDWAVAGGTQAEVYAKLHPGILQAIMEFERAELVYQRFSAQAADAVDQALASIYEDGEGIISLERARMR